jgi:hypothetical protein
MSAAIYSFAKRHLEKISIAISLLLHILMIYRIAGTPDQTPLPAIHQVPIEIRTISKKVVAPKIIEATSSVRPRAMAKKLDAGLSPKKDVEAKPSDNRPSPRKGLAYKDLLPDASSLGLNAGSSAASRSDDGNVGDGDSNSEGNGPYHGTTYQNIMIDSHILKGMFDVPLFFYEKTGAPRAPVLKWNPCQKAV